MICNRSIDWEGMLCLNMLCRLICRWKGFVSVCRVRRITEFVKKRVTLMEKVFNREYHLDDQNIPANCSNGGVEPGEGPKNLLPKAATYICSKPSNATDNCFVVMGGEDGGNAYLNDVYILGTETMAWREVKTTGAELMLRAGHTTISHGKYQLVFGQLQIPLVLGLLHVSPLQEIPWTQSEAYDSSMGDVTKSLKLWMTCISSTQMLREKDPSEPKLSMRKELKRRRQEYRATPFVLGKQRDADKSLVSSHGEFQAHVQLLGEKMFEARVSDIFNYRYILEASIDGKLFCGLLFSYKPGFAQAVQSYMARFVSFDSQLLSMKHCNLQKISPMVFRRALLDLKFNKIWSISIHVHTLWDGKSNLQTCQASNLHCRPLLRYYRMKLKDKKILKGRLAKSLEDMHSFYDHGPNVENSSIIKKSCSLAFNLSHFWHKTISNTMHQELAGNYDLQSFQEGRCPGQKDAECSSLEGFPGLKGDATLLVVGIRVCNQTTYSMFAKSIIALD
ncbi:hypothetical protein SELMODRAFT_429459 [Selaginella moellendorffii]|uniref:Uncharacterized protein n=1 Tax=Selaginella moellendorffii TaxID=88036 RepID=D8T695_SELML|nr:hypothetical protein SELMODRAFT_429459 [Selaginella moellendorffii]